MSILVDQFSTTFFKNKRVPYFLSSRIVYCTSIIFDYKRSQYALFFFFSCYTSHKYAKEPKDVFPKPFEPKIWFSENQEKNCVRIFPYEIEKTVKSDFMAPMLIKISYFQVEWREFKIYKLWIWLDQKWKDFDISVLILNSIWMCQ